jgi:putative transposase
MIAFIDNHRGEYGVGPICKVLPIAPSTYHEHMARRRDPSRLSARNRRDTALTAEIRRVCDENFAAYGARKVWRQMNREGLGVARCTVERLMQAMGLAAAVRGKAVRTTVSDKAAPCPLDKVNRQFQAPGPNRLWVSDFTYVSNLAGICLCHICHRHFCQIHRWLAGEPNRADRLRSRRAGTGLVATEARSGRWPCSP